MPEPNLVHITNEINAYAALLLKYFRQGLDERLRRRGEALSSLQFSVLRMLQFETLTVSTISQRMGLDPSSTVRMIDSLERKGLALRGIDPRDRRRNPIQVTRHFLEGRLVSELTSGQPPTNNAPHAVE